MRSVDRCGPCAHPLPMGHATMILYESKNFSVQNFVLICAKDQQVVRFVIFDEVLESISCFVVNGDNRFDPDPRLQIPLNDISGK